MTYSFAGHVSQASLQFSSSVPDYVVLQENMYQNIGL